MPKICYVPKDFRAKDLDKIAVCNSIIEEYAAQGFDLTLRQLYYQLVSRDYIANNIREYSNLGTLVSSARLAGLIDWSHIVDRVRNLETHNSWDDPESIVDAAAQDFHLNRWKDQNAYVEVWIEKNALRGVIEPVCTELDVPYFVCIGYTSQSEMWRAARRLVSKFREGKEITILHLGDHDPSGRDMTRDISERLDLFMSTDLAPYARRERRFYGVEVNRLALNWNQIEQYTPPPNPAKLMDPRARVYIEEFGDESWELDALSPTTIAEIIRDAVHAHIDWDKWDEVEDSETQGKTLLETVSRRWSEVQEFLEGGENE
jgi:hypothetical protein